MESEVVVAILNEMLEEQKSISKKMEQMELRLWEISQNVGGFEEKMGNLKISAPRPDTRYLEEIIATEVRQFRAIVEAQPRKVVHEKRLLLFPEYNAREYYNAVLKWIFWMFVAFLVFLCVRNLIDRF